jgi:hypothetical protein
VLETLTRARARYTHRHRTRAKLRTNRLSFCVPDQESHTKV